MVSFIVLICTIILLYILLKSITNHSWFIMKYPIELKLELNDVHYLIDLLDIDSHLSYEDDLSFLAETSKRLKDEIQLQTYLWFIMNHPNTPVYYTVSSVCPYDGSTNVLAICEDMDAVSYRLKQCYTTCGDEYVINAYHLTTAEDAAVKYNEQLVSRREYQAKEKEKEDKIKAYDESQKEWFTIDGQGCRG